MGLHFACLDVAIVAVKIDPILVFAGVLLEAGRVEAWTDEQVNAAWPGVGLDQLEHGQWSGRFVAVDAGGNVNG